MDPVSQLSTVISLLGTAKQLKDAWDKYRDATKEVQETISQCETTEHMLKLARSTLERTRIIEVRSADRESIVILFNTSIKGIMKILKDINNGLPVIKEKKNSKLGIWQKTKFIWNQDFFVSALQKIKEHREVIKYATDIIIAHGVANLNDRPVGSGNIPGSATLQVQAQTRRSNSDSQMHPRKLLLEALESTNPNDLDRVLSQGISTETPLNQQEDRPLHVVARNGNQAALFILLRHGAAIDTRNKRLSTPLISALDAHQTQTALILLASGAKVSTRTRSDKTPLHYAAWGNLLIPLQNLVASGADPNAADEGGVTPLHMAVRPVQGGKPLKLDGRVLQCLLDAGAKPTSATLSSGLTPLHILAEAGQSQELDLLAARADTLDFRADPKKANQVATPLYLAAYHGHKGAVRVLLDRGASVDEPPRPGLEYPNALWAAFIKHNFGSAELLLEHGANPDTLGWISTGSSNPSPGTEAKYGLLHLQASTGNMATLKMLIKHKAMVDVRSSNGETPLHLAARYGKVHAAQFLLENGAEVDSANKEQVTALMFAALNGRLPVVHLLCRSGANWKEPPDRRASAFIVAITEGHLDTAAYLLALGADINENTLGGYRPLHYAVLDGESDAAHWLLALGADRSLVATNIRDPFTATGTAEDVARALGHIEVAALLAGDL